jgi:hypothetical protein
MEKGTAEKSQRNKIKNMSGEKSERERREWTSVLRVRRTSLLEKKV